MSNTASPKSNSYPRIVITPGEPAGIGVDLTIELAQRSYATEIIACCDPELLLERANELGKPLSINRFEPTHEATINNAGSIKVSPVKLKTRVKTGQLDVSNAEYVLECLKVACQGCQHGLFDAMTTGPVQKSVINDAGIPFSGHTEFLAELCDNAYPVMMLANRKARVALVTTHLPLTQVSEAIDQNILEKTLKIIHHDLTKRFGIIHPKIYICGLNPHAGEGGHMGREEIEVIEPVINNLLKEGMDLTGPLPADTLFTQEHLSNADVIVAMFHDQGLPALKALGFGETVNVTLGLPIIRTSVDHGTALDLAGTGKAEANSFHEALNMAIEQASAQKNLT